LNLDFCCKEVAIFLIITKRIEKNHTSLDVEINSFFVPTKNLKIGIGLDSYTSKQYESYIPNENNLTMGQGNPAFYGVLNISNILNKYVFVSLPIQYSLYKIHKNEISVGISPKIMVLNYQQSKYEVENIYTKESKKNINVQPHDAFALGFQCNYDYNFSPNMALGLGFSYLLSNKYLSINNTKIGLGFTYKFLK
jgi:hypothetical protein